ncbi:chemotaxis response regulator protein-glutamate methylesterase [Dissulfurispira thermophila]|uniref:Protein-glutamate methylesterase/protein-glutamine glutaminase n=1 Tax=Dissulfurispira thermophila TaxID=2715679 RepID=A0A7G1GXV8_9BACT|nr:chemotaxis-specific protein-glutamate methyltransferase CheB [Dissulfurispira thermophila]BCB95190.1 chemotaxis response regulator protein-glutamate methylesterase [Dissulfurispira thermophila]
MRPIRVLIVDDSRLIRELIIEMLSADKDIIIAGEASNGSKAVQMVKELKPDIVTMDIEMPVMNGLDAIEHIMSENAVPILVVTSKNDAQTAYDAISRGALDLVQKPEVNLNGAKEFIAKIKLLSGVKVVTHIAGRRRSAGIKPLEAAVFSFEKEGGIIAIASSTGGPKALSIILSSLPSKFPFPIVIAQHISDGFVHGMAEWLNKVSKLNVKVASDGDLLTPATVYISPSEMHMKVSPSKTITFIERQQKDIYHPSCDMLLSSVADVYGKNCIGIILTGMGTDGVEGMRKIKKSGGVTIAQDEKTSVIFGMNKAAIDSGCIDRILPIEKISRDLVDIAALKQVQNHGINSV